MSTPSDRATAVDCDRLRIAFAGTPAFAATALSALIAGRHDVVGVLSQPDRPAGRGRKLVASPVKSLALEHGIEVQQPSSLKDPAAVAALAGLEADVLVVAAYGLILPQAVLSLPALGCLNIHASLLPRWRGAAPIHRAILAGDTVSGVCIMQMDAGLDTGDVLLERRVPIPADATSATLHDTLAELGAEAIVTAIDGRCRGTLTPRAQPTDGVTYADKLDKAEAVIDWSQTAIAIDRRIRAFLPWPVAESVLDDERVRLWGSRLGDGADDAPPGTVLSLRDGALQVATGEGQVALTHLQRDGGRALDATTFAHDRSLVGRRFGS